MSELVEKQSLQLSPRAVCAVAALCGLVSATHAADPCGPGYRQAPQTDRCDPVPGAAGAKARAAGLAGKFPAEGQSLGGIVRDAPSQSAAKVASLAEGAPVKILERAAMWDNDNWFRISFGGRSGYQWGGIMCSRQPLSGIFRQCDQP